MFEHPSTAKSWLTQAATEVLKPPRVMIVDFDVCKFGMESEDTNGKGTVKKGTRIMTNCIKLAKRLMKAPCSGAH